MCRVPATPGTGSSGSGTRQCPAAGKALQTTIRRCGQGRVCEASPTTACVRHHSCRPRSPSIAPESQRSLLASLLGLAAHGSHRQCHRHNSTGAALPARLTRTVCAGGIHDSSRTAGAHEAVSVALAHRLRPPRCDRLPLETTGMCWYAPKTPAHQRRRDQLRSALAGTAAT